MHSQFHYFTASFTCNFASILYNALVRLERNWRSLVADIAAGKLTSELRIDDDVRERINAHLKPNPKRAAVLKVSVFN